MEQSSADLQRIRCFLLCLYVRLYGPALAVDDDAAWEFASKPDVDTSMCALLVCVRCSGNPHSYLSTCCDIRASGLQQSKPTESAGPDGQRNWGECADYRLYYQPR